jgi:hypothetical protein
MEIIRVIDLQMAIIYDLLYVCFLFSCRFCYVIIFMVSQK